MAKLSIWNIGVANRRIEELETQVGTLTAETVALKAALESNGSEISTAAEQVTKDLDTAKSTIATLTGQLNTATTQVTAKDAEIAALGLQLKSKDGEVKIQVAQGVAQVQAALGAPPLAAAPAEAKFSSTKTGIERVREGAKADLQAGGFKFQN